MMNITNIVIIITSFPLLCLSRRAKPHAPHTDLPVTGDYTANPFSSLPSFFASNISNMKYPFKPQPTTLNSAHLLFLLNSPDSCKLLDTRGGKFRKVYTGFLPTHVLEARMVSTEAEQRRKRGIKRSERGLHLLVLKL